MSVRHQGAVPGMHVMRAALLTRQREHLMPRLMIRPRSLVRFSALAAALPVFVMAGASQAQTPPPRPTQTAPAQPAPAAGKAAPAPKSNATQTAANEAALRQRVEQLEEQLIDLQVIIGTLESLARPPAAAASTDRASGDAARIQALEAQLKSLSTQIEQLGEKVRGAGEPTQRSEAGPVQHDSPRQ